MRMNDLIGNIVGILIVLGFLMCVGIVLFFKVPEGSQRLADIMLGALGTMAAAVVNFFFGSSVGSKKKTEIMAGTPVKDRT